MLRDPATSPTPAAEGDITITPSVLYVGSAVALVTTRNADGSADISPMSSVWALGDRLVLGLTEESKGCENLLRERELVVNFPTPDLWREVEAIARCTGRDPVPPEKAAIGYVSEPDKFRRAGLTPLSAAVIAAPRIKECAIQFEARVMAVHDATRCTPGGAARGFQIIEARVVRVHAHRRVVIPGTNYIDCAQWSPLLYVFRHYFGRGPDLGRTFKAEA